MKNAVFAVIAALCLSACASNSQVAEKALSNLEFCSRSYTAIVGGLGANGGSINIDCPARPFPAAVGVTIPAAAQ